MPTGLAVDLVDPGSDPAAAVSRSAGQPLDLGAANARTASGGPTFTGPPAMITRAQWGARPSGDCSPVFGDDTLGAVLHHTDGTNSYSRSQSRAIMRGMQLFHMRSRGWCDIGYNFVVDKYGQIFVGRGPDIRAQIRGAHAGNWDVNTYTMGVSMMGNFDRARPSAAMKNAIVRLIGWRFGTNFLPATGTYRLDGHTFARIMGHRDVYLSGIRPATATACPGRFGYAWLRAAGGLRTQVAAYISNYSSAIKTQALAMGAAATGTLFRGEFATTGGRRADFSLGSMLWSASTGVHWVPLATRSEYAVFRNEPGPLGFPTGELTADPTGASVQTFQRGAIYVVGSAAYGLTQGVNDAYAADGGLGGGLGAPTSRATTSVVNGHTIDQATFEHGSISFDRTTGTAATTMW